MDQLLKFEEDEKDEFYFRKLKSLDYKEIAINQNGFIISRNMFSDIGLVYKLACRSNLYLLAKKMFQQMIQYSCQSFDKDMIIVSHMPFNIILKKLISYCYEDKDTLTNLLSLNTMMPKNLQIPAKFFLELGMSFGNLPVNYVLEELNLGGIKKPTENTAFVNTNDNSKLIPSDFFTNPKYIQSRLKIRYFASKNTNFRVNKNFVNCALINYTFTADTFKKYLEVNENKENNSVAAKNKKLLESQKKGIIKFGLDEDSINGVMFQWMN